MKLSLAIITPITPINFIKKYYPTMVSAFIFASSNATLPTSIKQCDKNGNFSKNLLIFTSSWSYYKYGRNLYNTIYLNAFLRKDFSGSDNSKHSSFFIYFDHGSVCGKSRCAGWKPCMYSSSASSNWCSS